MISVIVCSRDWELFDNLSQNIQKTIGIENEVIRVDNPEGRLSICEAYNKGAGQAKYPFLCFVHEDVSFITNNWGKNLIDHFDHDPLAGVIGIAGSIYKTKMLSSWKQPLLSGIEPSRMNYIQKFNYSGRNTCHIVCNPLNENRSEVVSLDGVFMATRKKVWEEIRFDQNSLKGFHGYDLDFSLRVGKQFHNYVVYDILLEHFSEGIFDINWLKQTFWVHKKNKTILPMIKSRIIPKKMLRQADKINMMNIIWLMRNRAFKKTDMVWIFWELVTDNHLFRPNIAFIKSFFKTILFKKHSKEIMYFQE